MPQKRVEVKGYAPQMLFRAETMHFIKKRWPGRFTGQDVDGLELCAFRPKQFVPLSLGELAGNYIRQPDAALAVLQFIRNKWSHLDKTNSGRLKKYFAVAARSQPKGKKRIERTDKDIALKWYPEWAESVYGSPETVSEDMVTKARKWVAARIKV